MKKITLMIFVSLMSFFAYAQLPVEHFDDPWTGTPGAPPDWVVINEFGPNITWAQTIPGNGTQPPFGGDGYSAYLQKETVAPTAAIPSDWLITKVFQCSCKCRTEVSVKVNYFRRPGRYLQNLHCSI